MRTGGWRPALRIARRDVLRAKGRSALVVLMVGLPVLLVSTLATMYTTNNVSPVEQLPMQMGAAQAQVIPAQRTPIDQDPWGHWGPASPDSSAEGPGDAWTPAEVRAAVGAPLLEFTDSNATVQTTTGRRQVRLVAADVASPQLAGFVGLRSGRLPARDDEVVVSPGLAAHGFEIGRQLNVVPAPDSGSDPKHSAIVVGIVTVPSVYDESVVVARPGSATVAAADTDVHRTYLVPGPAPVTWQRVRELNQVGLAVVSRSVVEHPPADWRSAMTNPEALPTSGSAIDNGATQAILVLVVFSIVLEVVLLAGPAFAVGVRRQRRQLALVAAAGGTARDVRRIVLAQALVTGALASVAGAALGLPLAAALTWVLPRVRLQTTLGPFDVAGIPVLVAACLGGVAALAAAYFPARAAAREDVVAVLAGRRGQLRSRRGLPVLGVLMLAAGASLALVRGIRQGGEFYVAGGTLIMVLGAITMMPSVLGGIGRLGRWLPLPLRLAARDSARQRGRTAPAVAAVMAAVAGVTALAIGGSSDFAQRRAEYQPRQPAGVTTVRAIDQDASWWRSAAAAVGAVTDGRTLLPVGQLGTERAVSTWSDAVYVAPAGCPGSPPELSATASDRCSSWQTTGLDQPGEGYGVITSLVAEPAALTALGYRLDAHQRSVLERGGVLLPSARLVGRDGRADLVTYQLFYTADSAKARRTRTQSLPAAALPPRRQEGMLLLVGAIVTPETAERLGTGWQQTSGVLAAAGQPLSRNAQDALEEQLLGTASGVEVYTERGFDESLALPLLGLAIVASLAVLVGTLTATGLALADSRPDAATLTAVGARPRTRRTMAAAQAIVIGLVGSLAGIGVGMVPGLAVTWPLTAPQRNPATGVSGWGSPTIDVPWLLLLAVGLAVPAVAALAAGIGVRSRLPLTRRLGQ